MDNDNLVICLGGFATGKELADGTFRQNIDCLVGKLNQIRSSHEGYR